MIKIINPVVKNIDGKKVNVFVKITFNEKNVLTISGVEGPKTNGNCVGSCGQIQSELMNDVVEFHDGFDEEQVRKLMDVWEKWHLNDSRPTCEHQRALGWGELSKKKITVGNGTRYATFVKEDENPEGLLCKPCPVCGYEFGTKWNFEVVPQDIIEWLFGLPDTSVKPAWA